MLTRDAELWACALAIERRYGAGAFLHAAMQIDAHEERGECLAASVWRDVLKRIEALEADKRPRQ
jgi:hypothetical protein